MVEKYAVENRNKPLYVLYRYHCFNNAAYVSVEMISLSCLTAGRAQSRVCIRGRKGKKTLCKEIHTFLQKELKFGILKDLHNTTYYSFLTLKKNKKQ